MATRSSETSPEPPDFRAGYGSTDFGPVNRRFQARGQVGVTSILSYFSVELMLKANKLLTRKITQHSETDNELNVTNKLSSPKQILVAILPHRPRENHIIHMNYKLIIEYTREINN